MIDGRGHSTASAHPDLGGFCADLGPGRGTFTAALAELLGPDARIVGLDSNAGTVRALRRRAARAPDEAARIEPVRGDLRRLDRVEPLGDGRLDGALLANVLHFFSDPSGPLSDVAARLRSGGRLVVIEYQGRPPSPWIPHPIPFEERGEAVVRAGLDGARLADRRPSAYRGSLYCAVVTSGGR